MTPRLITAICILALAIGTLAFVRRTPRAAQSSQGQAREIPLHVMYKHLFHHVIALKRKAAEVEKEGRDSKQFKTHFTRRANLSPEQGRLLEQVAVDWDQDAQLIMARAKSIIEVYKAKYPGGQVPHGQTPGQPPAELKHLSEERDALTLRARDRLRTLLGEFEFNRFDNFVKTKIAANVEMMSPK